MNKVSSFLGDNAEGIPYIIIGSKTWEGYASSIDDEIKSYIENLYNSEEKYDVINEVLKEDQTNNQDTLIYIILILSLAFNTFVLFKTNSDKKYFEKEIQKLELKIKNSK